MFDANPCIIFPELQLSFQMWTDQMQDSLNCKQKGDAAFRHKDFKLAIECYTQVVLLFCFVFLTSTVVADAMFLKTKPNLMVQLVEHFTVLYYGSLILAL